MNSSSCTSSIKKARNNLNRNIWDYLIGGTETETTVRRNRLALDSVAFRPRVLVDVSHVDTTGTFFGRRVRLPVCLAPVGSLESFEAGGGATVAEAAGKFGVPIFVSSVTRPGLEAVAAAGNGPKVFQLYVRGDAEFVDDHVRRAVDSGYDAFCITVDTALYSRRERDITKRFRKYWRSQSGMDFQAALNWRDIERFKSQARYEAHPKGIATGEDAARACAHGRGWHLRLQPWRPATGPWPRQPRRAAGNRAAVAGRAKMIVDGGFSRGSDILKAIALGADSVGIGRLYCYGLAAAGVDGVMRVLELLETEVEECLGLAGVSRFSDLDRTYPASGAPVTPPHVHSAFPHLSLPDERY